MDRELLEGLVHARVTELVANKQIDDVVQLVLLSREQVETAMQGMAVEMRPRVEKRIEQLRQAVDAEEKKLRLLNGGQD